jgi:hypothetical protein
LTSVAVGSVTSANTNAKRALYASILASALASRSDFAAVPPEFHTLNGWRDRQRVEEAAFDLLAAALDRIYRNAQKTWESRHAQLPTLTGDHANLKFTYRVRVPQSMVTTAATFVQELESLIRSCPKEQWDGTEPLAAVVHFGEHLYQPLLIALAPNHQYADQQAHPDLTMSPPRLTKSEQEFVEMLRDYWRANGATVHADERIYLLRNLSRGKGVGFFESEGFYPDFILWHLLADGRQRLVFIEPHGMRQEDAPDVSSKIKIASEISQHLQAAIAVSGQPITATAFIISATPFAELARKHGQGWTVDRYAHSHILFPDRVRSQPCLGGILATDDAVP